jgi:hypothetical protein
MSLSNKIINPNRVRELMASMQADIEKQEAIAQPDNKIRNSREYNACQMILKTSCSVSSAARSWSIPIHKILKFAKRSNIQIVYHPHEMDDKAKAIIENGSYKKSIPRGLKQRVAYELALRVGVSEACRTINVCRRGLYYYCDRYNLPTPERSERRVR